MFDIKRLKYQITLKKYIWITVENAEQERLVRSMNNEFDKAKKKRRTYFKKCFSIDSLHEQFGYELSDGKADIDELYIQKETKEFIAKGINRLPTIQKRTIVDYFYRELSFNQIAKLRKANVSSVYESYKSALRNLKKFFDEIKFEP